jgi:PTS system nitrogen regulatory IIA component
VNIATMLPAERVLLNLKVRDKEQLLLELGRIVAGSGAPVTAASVTEALRRREQLGSTGLGKGFALPHASMAGIEAYVAVLARLAQPIAFDAIDGAPVDLVCLLLTPADGLSHVAAMAAISRRFRDPDCARRIRAAGSVPEIEAALA